MTRYKPTRPKPQKQPEHLAIRDPFKRAMLRRMDAIAEAIDRNTAAVAELRERICVFVQRPAVPVVKQRNGERHVEVDEPPPGPAWLDDERKEPS